MTSTVDDLDVELERLSVLAKDYRRDTLRWNIVWDRIDRLLEERGKLLVEVDGDNNSGL